MLGRAPGGQSRHPCPDCGGVLQPLDRSHNGFVCERGHRVPRARLWTPAQRAANAADSRRWQRGEREARRRIVRERKDEACVDCGGCWPHFVMELHHEDPSEKVDTVANMTLKVTNYSRDQLLVEMDKCVLLCSNCHRVRTYG